MRSFSKSLPANRPVYEYFGFEVGKIAVKVRGLVGIEALRGNFKERLSDWNLRTYFNICSLLNSFINRVSRLSAPPEGVLTLQPHESNN